MSSYFRNSVEWALMVALVFGGGFVAQNAQAQNGDKEAKGRIVQIGPDSTKGTNATATDDQTATAGEGQQPVNHEVPKYWIGLMGGPIPAELRAHLDVPENQGVMVRSVVPDSPAAKAGVKNFDIVLKANDADVHDMRDLLELVKTAGDQKASISLDVLRKGGHQTVTVTPADRPAHVAMQGMPGIQGMAGMPGMPGQDGYGGQGGQGGQGGGFGGMNGIPSGLDMEQMQKMMQQFGGNGGNGRRPFAFRQFGPGVIVNGMPFGGGAAIPNGVSVSITKENNQPAHITIKRGSESWEVTGDDAESLQQLPEDLRPFAQQLLTQNQGGAGGMGTFNMAIPPQGMPMPGVSGTEDEHEQDLQQRLDTIEQQLKDLEQRLDGGKTTAEKTLP